MAKSSNAAPPPSSSKSSATASSPLAKLCSMNSPSPTSTFKTSPSKMSSAKFSPQALNLDVNLFWFLDVFSGLMMPVSELSDLRQAHSPSPQPSPSGRGSFQSRVAKYPKRPAVREPAEGAPSPYRSLGIIHREQGFPS